MSADSLHRDLISSVRSYQRYDRENPKSQPITAIFLAEANRTKPIYDFSKASLTVVRGHNFSGGADLSKGYFGGETLCLRINEAFAVACNILPGSPLNRYAWEIGFAKYFSTKNMPAY